MQTTYHSKIDVWILVLLIAAVAVGIAGAASAVAAGGFSVLVVAAIPLAIAIGLPAWVFISTRYTLGRDLLLVQSGPFKWKVPVAEITAVTPTRNPLSSPALSLDRLRIDYGSGKSLMVSPEDKNKFLADLEAFRRPAVAA